MNKTLIKTEKIIPLILSSVLLFLFFQIQSSYHSPATLLESNPHVTNLKAAGQLSYLKIGIAPTCNDHPCWVEKDFDDSAWETFSLPLNPNGNVTQLKNYKKRDPHAQLYYRTALKFDDNFLNENFEISFAQLFIMHKDYSVYINDTLVMTSNGENLGSIANISIPKKYIKDNSVEITIIGSLHDSDRGISHFGASYMGPKPILDNVFLFSERATYSFFLLFLLTKGSIFVVFTFFFFFSKVQAGFKYFLSFAFFVTIENLFMGDFLAGKFLDLNQRVFLTYSCKTFAIAGLAGFFLNFYHVNRLRKYVHLLNGVFIAVILSMAFDFAWGSKSVNFRMLWNISNAYLIVVTTFFTVIGFYTINIWKKNRANGAQYTTYILITLFILAYLLLSIDSFYFNAYAGYESRNLFDLAFFFVLASVTAKDMGSQQKRILSLESHMIEKSRMEDELQEAAEIAKAFLPSQKPNWIEMKIAIFHKPLTENSGDWYAFEQSKSGRFQHFIMCDITGHGVQAALVVSTCKSILSSFTHANPQNIEKCTFIVDYMKELNWTLFHNGKGFHVSTMLGLTFDNELNSVHYICAGHPAPLLFKNELTRKPIALSSRNNLLGTSKDFDGVLKSREFDEGDILICYTDGLPVGTNVKALNLFSSEMLNHSAFKDIPQTMVNVIWKSEAKRKNRAFDLYDDDISVVAFQKIKGG